MTNKELADEIMKEFMLYVQNDEYITSTLEVIIEQILNENNISFKNRVIELLKEKNFELLNRSYINPEGAIRASEIITNVLSEIEKLEVL